MAKCRMRVPKHEGAFSFTPLRYLIPAVFLSVAPSVGNNRRWFVVFQAILVL